jgi:N-acetylglucosaminyldiphosphoundecaprenol N-acetyl-beta-D-mannosaminyltransferase
MHSDIGADDYHERERSRLSGSRRVEHDWMTDLLSTTAAPPAAPRTQPILGIPLALTDYERTLDWVDATVESGGRGYICVAAVHTVMACQEDPELLEAVLGSDFTVPDGQPLVWALNMLGHRLRDRVYGPDLMELACERARRTGRRMFLYGGRDSDPTALPRLEAVLLERFPGLQIAGTLQAKFSQLSDEESDAVAEAINESGAEIVWVGLGVPRQEKWMAQMRERLDAPVLVGVGAAFDFHAGLVKQAPDSLQRIGMEWLFRLLQEPRRLWRRYARYNPRFVAGFLRQYSAHQRSKG